MLATGLRISYGDFVIVDGLALDFEPGINLITGPSGSGKSTILKALFGTLTARFDAWEGRDSRKILILQEDALIPWLSGWENILLFSGQGISTGSIENDPLFPHVSTFLELDAWRMSFGQRRMIELLRARLAHPEILLLDEPLNYLDPARKAALVQSLLMVNSPEFVIATTHETLPFDGDVVATWQLDGSLPIRLARPGTLL